MMNIGDVAGTYRANYSDVDRGGYLESGRLTLILDINGKATFTYNRVMSEKSITPTIRSLETMGTGSWAMPDKNRLSLNIDRGYLLIGTYAVNRDDAISIIIQIDNVSREFRKQ